MNEKNLLLETIVKAGQAILDLQKKEIHISLKSNSDIVTQADYLVNDILKNTLMSAYPDDGWLSEETVDNRDRLKYKRVWIVDPIDGTKEFVKRIPEFAISVALVENGVPMLAAVYNPLSKELFHAMKGEGAYLNQQRIHCQRVLSAEKFLLLASRSEEKRGEWDKFKREHEVKVVGSIAYKLALLAAGKADATFSLGPKNEWDIAAGVLLVLEAGGQVSDKQGVTFVFNQANTLVDSVIAYVPEIEEAFLKLIRYQC